jgi:hypothetical protein
MTVKNFFYKFCGLKTAGRGSRNQPHFTSLGGYRNHVRPYAEKFGDRTLGEAPDEELLGPLELAWQEGLLELWKYEPATNTWWDFSELPADAFFGRSDFAMWLTAKGREALNQMEAALVPPPPPDAGPNTIGFLG